MQLPTDNSFVTVFNSVFNTARSGELLDIERALRVSPGLTALVDRRDQLSKLIFIELMEARTRIQNQRTPAPVNRPEPRLDSRIIAEQLGVEHQSTIRTIDRYKADLEHFGLLGFEIQVRDRGIPTRFALLNENQCYFLATLSRNTAQVVAFKMWLVKTFSEYRTGERAAMPAMPMLT